MKINILTPSVSAGGLYRVAIEETKFLQKVGHEVRLISLIKPINPWNDVLDSLEVEYLADYTGPTPFLSEILNRNLFLLKQISSKADVWLCHNLPSCYIASKSAFDETSKVISYVHDPIHFTLTGNTFQILFKMSSLKRKLATKWLKRSDMLIVNSRRSQKTLADETGLHSNVLYPTLSNFAAELPKKRHNFFLTIGRIGLHPTYQTVLDILHRVPDMNLIIAGSWSHTANQIIRMFSSDEDIKTRVIFKINPTDAELQLLCKTARAFLYPGIENFNMSAFEAASNGCPIIVSKESGICELLGSYPYSARHNDVDEFAKMVRIFKESETDAIRSGQFAHDILSSYGYNYHMNRLRSIVEEAS